MQRSARWSRFIAALRIRTNDPDTGAVGVKRLRYNVAQQKVWRLVAERIDRGQPIRLLILKARREGISTAIESWLVTMITESDLVNALITAHMAKPAHDIWAMSKFFVTSSELLARIAKIENATITVGRSQLTVATAGSPESQRGGDLTAWHASEAAFYSQPEVMTATMQCLPQDDRVFSIGVIESTANGMEGDGELFYDEWVRAEAGDSDWLAVFLAWHEFLAYRIPAARIEDVTPEEYSLRERFELTDEQLAWRRWAIRNKCRGKVSLFRQEYPSFPEEAFRQAGRPFFEPDELLPFGAAIRKGVKGTVTPEGQWLPSESGWLEVFRPPESGHQYVVGADSSMGIADSPDDKKKHSRSAAEVIDMETLEQVAEYDTISAPHIMARHLAGIGRMYNTALLAPEIQSSGGGGGREVLVFLRNDYQYWNIHRWNRNEDKIQPQPRLMIGWECVDPDARILTADLRWVAARQIKVGDRLIGCHEHHAGRGGDNYLRVQTVLDRQVFVAPMVEVTLADGRRTKVSANHPFWIGRRNRSGRQREWRWIEALHVRPGDTVRGLQTWDTMRSYEAGRLSGLLDGEGHLSQGRPSGLQMLVSQAEGPLADEIRAAWAELGFRAMFKWVRHKRPHEKPVATCGPIRFADVLHALGSLRPTRLLRKFLERIDLGRFTIRCLPTAVIVSMEPIGDGPVIGLTTDPDHTLIADGILGHNTNSRTRPRMLARIREVVMERSAVIHSRALFKQLASFGEGSHQHLEALAGHDDLLFAYGIALMSRSENYFKAPPVMTSPPVIDWQALGIRVGMAAPDTGEGIRQRIAMTRATAGEPKSFLDY